MDFDGAQNGYRGPLKGKTRMKWALQVTNHSLSRFSGLWFLYRKDRFAAEFKPWEALQGKPKKTRGAIWTGYVLVLLAVLYVAPFVVTAPVLMGSLVALEVWMANLGCVPLGVMVQAHLAQSANLGPT